ncbi:MAG: hypothetical protein H6Q80_166 [Deltaproteobacteria bacterium]|jgi:hypothetical protein|nr:hypothetical protein [Deltaproteobacteria bacterium]
MDAVEPAPQRIGLAALYALCLAPPPGKVAGILGPGACRLALRALARPLLSGEPVVAVDGGNRFDPYEVARAERALGGSGREALSRLLVSRAFTCHQLEALLARRLPGALSRSGARVVLVLGLPETFADEDVPYVEACRVFRGCLSALRRLSREGTRVVVAGESATGLGGGHSVQLAGDTLPLRPPTDQECPPGGMSSRAGFFRYLERTSDPLLVLTGWRG